MEAWTLTGVEVLEEQPALGKGAYGVVYRAWWKGIEVAAKRVHDALTADTKGVNGVTNKAVQGIEDEGDMMQRLRHPHLVQFLGIYHDNLERLHIVMEKLQESLADLLARSEGPLFETQIYSIGTDVTSALRYMHELPTPIAHRDVTPKNILLTADLRAKVSDLGACKYVLKTHAMTATLAPGNPKYMPPEALDGGRFAKYAPPAVDVYSLAIVLLEMSSGTDPEPSAIPTYIPCPMEQSKFYRVPEQERRSACFERIREDHPLTELIIKCTAADHTQRPDMTEIQSTLLALQGKHPPRGRSKPVQPAMHTSHKERTPHHLDGNNAIYDDVSPITKADHHYQNIDGALAEAKSNTPPRPRAQKVTRRPPLHDASKRQEEMGLKSSLQHAANQRQSISPECAVADQSGYEPLQIYQHSSEGKGMKSCQDNNEYLGLAMGPSETEYDHSSPRKRAETDFSTATLNKVKIKGRANSTVDKSQKVEPCSSRPPLPPWPNPPRKPHPPAATQEPPVYDTIEDIDMETVLKVTEPSKKKNNKSFVNGAGHKLAALPVCQNELLITQDRMSGQNDVVHARNTEGKAGWIADTQVQLVKPVNFMHSYSSDGTSSAGILHHLTYGKIGTKAKVIHISSSKITKGNLETLTSLANTDVVAADKQNSGVPAYFQIDFLKQRLVRVDGYLLQWTGVMGRFGYPLKWVVEISFDGIIWKEVDRKQQRTTAKNSQYWAARHKILGRYLRISLQGTNSAENDMLCLSGMELYGDLYTSVPLDDQYAYA